MGRSHDRSECYQLLSNRGEQPRNLLQCYLKLIIPQMISVRIINEWLLSWGLEGNTLKAQLEPNAFEEKSGGEN